ncbi:hypothetical protein D3C71_1491210 [compost metagenome]
MVMPEHFSQVIGNFGTKITEHHIRMCCNTKGILSIENFHHIHKQMHVTLPVFSDFGNSGGIQVYRYRSDVVKRRRIITSKATNMVFELLFTGWISILIIRNHGRISFEFEKDIAILPSPVHPS